MTKMWADPMSAAPRRARIVKAASSKDEGRHARMGGNARDHQLRKGAAFVSKFCGSSPRLADRLLAMLKKV